MRFPLYTLFFGRGASTGTDLENAYLIHPVEQVTPTRNWHEIEFVQTGISAEYIASNHIRFGVDGYIYLDNQDLSVIQKYNTEAVLVNTYGSGRERGPGEFSAIVDVVQEVTSGNVWVLDDVNNRVTIMNPEDAEDKTIIPMPEVAWRAIPVGNGHYVFENRFNHQLKKYSLSGELLGMFPPITDDPFLWAYVFENKYSISPDHSVVFVFVYLNTFLRMSASGEVLFFREPIMPPGPAPIVPYYQNTLEARIHTLDLDMLPQYSKAVRVVNNTFHLFVLQEDNKNPDRRWNRDIVDVYSLENGDYLYSYRPPQNLINLVVSDTHLAGISEETNKLMVWELTGGWPK